MQQVVTTASMRLSDKYTIEHFTDSKELMYRAALAIFKNANYSGKIAIVCGKGNNGGDGYALSCILSNHNISNDLYLLEQSFSPDGLYYFNQAISKGANKYICDFTTDFSDYDYIVDCIFGTGFKGQPTGLAEYIIQKINDSKAFVISADINSGLNGDTGKAVLAIKSDITVSIGTLKIGQLINDSHKYIKKLVNEDIGIKIITDCYYLINEEELNQLSGNNFQQIEKDTLMYLSDKPELENNNPEVELFYINNQLYIKK